MKLSDFKGVLKTVELEFINIENVSEDYYIIRLKKPEGLVWRPGEHAIFSLPHKNVEGKKTRAFSIASTSKEENILLGTRTGKAVSSFKQNLIDMKQGEKVLMRGPFGWFVQQDDTTPSVLISLGVGVTPMRALLKEFSENGNINVDFIYSSTSTFLFEEEINQMINANENFDITYAKTIEETNEAVIDAQKKYGNNAYYYIGGSQNGIKAITKLLKSKGIKRKKIIHDPFIGY
jgi:NAD(P)H-flavin reductase